jgi:hypothetical protein
MLTVWLEISDQSYHHMLHSLIWQERGNQTGIEHIKKPSCENSAAKGALLYDFP